MGCEFDFPLNWRKTQRSIPMDAETRAALLARLSDLRQRRATLNREVQRQLAAPRPGKGNPFFYSAVPPDHPKSEAHYTGASDQGLEAILELRRILRDITDIERQIGAPA